MDNEILKQVIEVICKMNDPKFISALQHIGQVCREKSDVLINLQDIQNRFDAAQNEINKCNSKLKELIK